MSWADRCRAEFDDQLCSRGQKYYRDGRVHLTTQAADYLSAFVQGKSGDYEVALDWSCADEGLVSVACNCPYYCEWGTCKHIWATMLTADAVGVGPPGNRPLVIIDENIDELLARHEEDTAEASHSPRGWSNNILSHIQSLLGSPGKAAVKRAKAAKKPKASKPRAPDWRQQLAPVFAAPPADPIGQNTLPQLGKTREIWYVLDLSRSVAEKALAILFFQREMKLNGEFGKLKALSLANEEVGRLPDAEDRRLMAGLLTHDLGVNDPYDSYRGRYSYYSYQPKISEVALDRSAYDALLPALCATQRLVWAADSERSPPDIEQNHLAWDDGPPWRLKLTVAAADAGKGWRLTGQLARDGEALPSDRRPVLTIEEGLLVFADHLARLDLGDSASWDRALRQAPAIDVPYSDRWEFLKRLWSLPARPDLDLPDGLRCEEARVEPQGRLTVHAPPKHEPNRLYADVEFRYDGLPVRPNDAFSGIVDEAGQRVLVRDRERERALLQSLVDRGARPAILDYRNRHPIWLPAKRFAGLVSELVQAGWQIEAEGHLFRKPGQFRMSVTSGVDWFDLDGECDFEGQRVALPELLAALERGENYVRLGDGTHGLLPQEWLSRFSGLAELGEMKDEHVRFRPTQAMLLDALLAAQPETAVDEQFQHVRERLRSFAGVAPSEAPEDFQGTLRPYQNEGLGWLHFLRDFRFGGCLADDMGLGKTVQVLALLEARRQRPVNGDGRRAPTLVVVPRSLVFNWIEEARRFTPQLRVLDYTGTLRADARERFADYDLIVTTYGTLHRDIAALKDVRFDYVILDEAQAIKNAQAQRAKACRLLQADHRLAMTGTPVENHLGELWSLFEFLNPGMLGSSGAFQGLAKATNGDSENLGLLRRALAPFILRRTKQQVLTELPEKTEQTLHCELEGAQRKKYDELREFYRASLTKQIETTGLAKSKIHVLEALLRLRQAACHPGLIDKDRCDESSAKLDMLMEQLAEIVDEGHKALVFSQFTSLLAIVRRRLDAEKIVYEYLDGRTRQRQERVERFQNDPACPLFLISLKAGGHGLNLTAADYVFILDPWWNPAVEAQAIDRTHRIGQTRRVFAYRLIAKDTVEEKILELQKTKRDLAEAVISADSNVLRNLTADDLQLLLS